MSDKTYNGWTNYETWNVKLWIDNDGSGSYWEDKADDTLREGFGDDETDDAAISRLANFLKESFEETKDELLDNAKLSASVWSDLLGAALSEVNWYEIAGSMINDAKERVA